MTPVVVLCIGNAFRRDDGLGPAVAAVLRDRAPDVDVIDLDGEPARLVDTWAGAEAVVLVDACRTGAEPGTITRFEIDHDRPPPAVTSGAVTSTHAASVGEAIALGRATGRVPASLVVFAVEGEDFAMGPGLSDRVEAAVGVVATRILADLRRCGPVDRRERSA
jgi:hydrogenase maturation protease